MTQGRERGSESDVLFTEATATKVRPKDAVVQSFVSGTGAVGEELRLLQTKLRIIDDDRRMQCFGIVSSSAGEGKSTIAVGLASLLAQDRSVLVIESDLRKPDLEAALGISPHTGLAEWLEGNRNEVAVRKILPCGFDLLSAGQARLKRPALLGGIRMRRLVDAARKQYDVVILDCAPLIPVADSVILQDVVDGFLLVVRARVCPRETVQKAVSHLKPGRIRGVVFNDHSEIIAGYESYGAGGYGYRS